MEFRVLGVFEALERRAADLARRAEAALGARDAAARRRTGSSPPTDLVDGLWGDDPPLRAAATLQVYVSNLRKALEPDRSPRAEPSVLLTQAPGYLLAVDPDQVDLFRFEQLVERRPSLRGRRMRRRRGGAVPRGARALARRRHSPISPTSRSRASRCRGSRRRARGAVEDRIDADLALGRDVELLARARGARRRATRTASASAASSCSRCTAPAGRPTRSPRTRPRARCSSTSSGSSRAASCASSRRRSSSRTRRSRPSSPRRSPPSDVARVLQPSTASARRRGRRRVVEEAAHSARRAEEALRGAIDQEQARRLSTTVAAAGATQVELIRARRVIADRVLDRRRRRPRRHSQVAAARVSGRGTAPRSARARTRGCCASSPRTRGGTSAASVSWRSCSRRSRAPAARASSARRGAGSRR